MSLLFLQVGKVVKVLGFEIFESGLLTRSWEFFFFQKIIQGNKKTPIMKKCISLAKIRNYQLHQPHIY
jgi:hypothetical protein